MCTRTNSVMSALTSAYAGYTATIGMDDPTMVTFSTSDHEIQIQPRVVAHTDPVAVLSTLLLWSRGLTAVTATWRHTTEENLHISIKGRLASGVTLRIYNSFPYYNVENLVYLEPGQGESATLDELGFLAAELHTHPVAA